MSCQALQESAVAFASICFVKVDSDEILRFYLSLNSEDRRDRFCAAVSDDAIARHCSTLFSARTFIVAYRIGGEIGALLEVHALQDDWHQAEIAMVCRPRADRRRILANLLQVTAWEASRRCCERLHTTSGGDATFNALFSGLGACRRVEGTLLVDLPMCMPKLEAYGAPV